MKISEASLREFRLYIQFLHALQVSNSIHQFPNEERTKSKGGSSLLQRKETDFNPLERFQWEVRKGEEGGDSFCFEDLFLKVEKSAWRLGT